MRTLIPLLTVFLLALPVSAELRHRVALLGAGEGWVFPEAGGHGIGIVGYDLLGLPMGSRFSAELNTDTLRLRYDQLRFWHGRLEFGVQATAQAMFAGQLTDYFRRGELDKGRSLFASYGMFSAFLKANLPAHNHFQIYLGVRKWVFHRTDDTDPAYVLPKDSWVFEPRLQYTAWWIKPDPSLRDRNRLFNRIRGFAAGLEVGLDFRTEAAPWGARDDTAFDPVDHRNTPNDTILRLRQWLRAGWQLHDRVRTQIYQTAAFGSGEDDLTRVRVGGLNPYVVPLAGAPWASFLGDKLVSASWSWHFRLWRALEAGLNLDGVAVQDMERQGGDSLGWAVGLGLFLDFQIEAFQFDLRGGWCPTMQWQSDAGQFSMFASFGWVWDSANAK
jgi:hypothetical protein